MTIISKLVTLGTTPSADYTPGEPNGFWTGHPESPMASIQLKDVNVHPTLIPFPVSREC